MKRSRMPDRTTPLRRTELRRSPTPAEDTRPSSAGPVKPRRRDTGPSKKVRDLVKARANGLCELCGSGHRGTVIHHRRPRAAGGSRDPRTNLPSNLVLLANECHLFLESRREWALLHGWLVFQRHDPSSVAVSIRGQWVYLNDVGEYVAVPQAKEAS